VISTDSLQELRVELQRLQAEISDHVHVLRYDPPSRGVWWERLEKLRRDADELSRVCRSVRDDA
jgi:hypothetical protein